MAKKGNQNNAAEYLAQVERDGRQIQSRTGLPWYKGAKVKYKKGQTSRFVVTLLITGYAAFGSLLYLANPDFLILWIVFGTVFLLMFLDASKKSKDDN